MPIYAKPKHIVITGASSGLGKALALHYATSGVTLGLVGRHEGRLDYVANQCREKGANVLIGIVDVTDAVHLKSWMTSFDALYPIDLCIANAGVSAGTGNGEENADQVKEIFDINVAGVVNTFYAVIEPMKQRKAGQIAVISSLAGWFGVPGAPAYNASKAAVRIFGQSWRGLYHPFGIAVNVVCPGFIKTPMTDVNNFKMPFLMESQEAAARIAKGLARNRGLITFPLRLFSVVRLLSMLPEPCVTWLGRKLPTKPAQ
jgi:short-subunit dehydrogenase